MGDDYARHYLTTIAPFYKDNPAYPSLLPSVEYPSASRLSDDDVARIADAVVERMRPSVLDVTAADMRRWLDGGGRG